MNMNHNDFRHKLSEFIDGSVTPSEKSAIEEHLKNCTACSDALAELRKTIEQVKQIEEVEAPVWMTQKIMANVRAEAEQKKGFFHRLFHPLAVKLPIQAVGVLFLTITVYYIYSSMHPAEKYAEAPMGRIAKQETTAKAQDAVKRKASESAEQHEKKVSQKSGYKSLDMKYEYERPIPPLPQDRTVASAPAPAKEVQNISAGKQAPLLEQRPVAPKAAAPFLMLEQAAPTAGATAQREAKREAVSDERKTENVPSADKEADVLLDITEHFVKIDLPERMKVKGLQYSTRKFQNGLTDLSWMQKMNAFRSNLCSNRYVVDVDFSGGLSKYLYCYDRSRITLLGIYELKDGTWSEIK
jgi:hypothetical protein